MESPTHRALAIVCYAYPATIFLNFAASSLVAAFALHNRKPSSNYLYQQSNRRTVLACLCVVVLSFVIDVVYFGSHALPSSDSIYEDQDIISSLFCLIVFGIQLDRSMVSKRLAWYPFVGSWLLALIFEVSIAVLRILIMSGTDRLHLGINLATVAMRCASLAIACGVFYRSFSVDAHDEERQSLLRTERVRGDGIEPQHNYSSTQESGEESDVDNLPSYFRRQRDRKEKFEKKLQVAGNWFQHAKSFKVLYPYVWPVGNRTLQLRAFAVIGCLLAHNALGVLIPRQTGIILDSLNGQSGTSPWLAVVVFALLRLAASQAGIDLLQQWLWLPVEYHSQEAVARASFSHIMHMSADFHDSSSYGELESIIIRTTNVNMLVESIFLRAFPMMIDLGIAVVYLSVIFGPYEAFITVSTGVVFIIFAGRLINRVESASRNRLRAMVEESKIRSSGLLNWQTVAAFNQIGYEDNRYANAVKNHRQKQQRLVMEWNISVALQATLLVCGLTASALLAVQQIRNGRATAGQFGMLLMYWAQLSSPLQFFSELGKSISDKIIELEQLVQIMRTKPSVQSQKGARPLKFSRGDIVFDNVRFGYTPGKCVIQGVSFTIPAGQTVAFVGSTGSGKSTLFKLLNRFYDVNSGSIRIDGQDIRDVDLYSIRDRIGVVHQNPTLFNDSVMNNVRYGKITASDEEVYEACKAASIHDKINSLSERYHTNAGERGQKLSGGEVQRVAIARAILKTPEIVLLDEATSAVDTDTELKIQESLKALCKGRTTLIIAHRLSTVMNADRIIVVEQGKIVETGDHDALVNNGGRYADLWSKQILATKGKKKEPTSSEGSTGILFNDLSPVRAAEERSKLEKTSERARDSSNSS